jgi:AraC-like DNA-binding protein
MKARHRITQRQVRLSADRPVRVEAFYVARDVSPHDHEFHEISIFTGGEVTHLTPAGKQLLKRGGAVVIPPGAVHAFASARESAVINVYFLPEWLDGELPSLWDEPGMVPLFCSGALVRTNVAATELQLDEPELLAAEHELRQLIAELSRPSPGQAYMKSCFLKTLAILSRAWCRSDPRWRESTVAPVVRLILTAVERAINTGEPFSVAATADEAGLSPDRLTAVFRQSLGYPPLEYYQRRRVQRACQLLVDAGRSITDVAMELGYADAPHFSRVFKEHRGLTPRAYRKTYVTPTPTSATPGGSPPPTTAG